MRDAADAGRARWFAHMLPLLRTRWGLGLGAAAAAIIVAAVVLPDTSRPAVVRAPAAAVRAGGNVGAEHGATAPQNVTTPTPSKDRGANVVIGGVPGAIAVSPYVNDVATANSVKIQTSGALGASETGSPTITVTAEAPAVDVQNSRLLLLVPAQQEPSGGAAAGAAAAPPLYR